ncbi:unnamed protein product [Cuscuta epithymum]|uniref:Uncharacterized protein n=1 Tax=Cuscuta epithymum TaxID=186058 RepID=A0AAV0G1M0_9ASTE|nr:unnamed protein product [Cuscuta epithymum]
MKMKRKKPHSKTTVHPTPPLTDKLAFLPDSVISMAGALSDDEQEALAYIISRPSGNNNRTTAAADGGADHPPSFDCHCFNCYMSYWARWDSSPNRHLIHQAIDAYEDDLQIKKEKNTGGMKKGGSKDSSSSSGGNPRNSEVITNGEDSGEAGPTEERLGSAGDGGGGEDGRAEQKGALRRVMAFVGEKCLSIFSLRKG